jgi:hypothetical protein
MIRKYRHENPIGLFVGVRSPAATAQQFRAASGGCTAAPNGATVQAYLS